MIRTDSPAKALYRMDNACRLFIVPTFKSLLKLDSFTTVIANKSLNNLKVQILIVISVIQPSRSIKVADFLELSNHAVIRTYRL